MVRRTMGLWVSATLLAGVVAACAADNAGTATSSSDDDDGSASSSAGGGTGGNQAVTTTTNSGGSGGLFGTGGSGFVGVTLSGRVMSPSGAFPISGALVSLTQTDPDPIPSGVYHYECDDLSGQPYDLSAPDGTWEITDVPPGTWKIVTRKGNFRRIREIEVSEDGSVAEEQTTLPGASSQDGLDTVPSFAVVRTAPDLTYNLLAKFGMGELDGGGELVPGTEQFDMYADTSFMSYPHTSALFDSQAVLDSYHHIFLPCYGSSVGVNFVNANVDKLRSFVSKGGKLYNSCTVSLWSEASFPDYIDFYQADDPTRFDIGRRTTSAYTTTGQVADNDLAAWLSVVSSADPNAVPFQNGYVTIDATTEVDDGHGLEEDNGVVKPFTWVSDTGSYPGSPLMVTYNYDYGKVFYSVYETSSGTVDITPQEFVLLYVILEVGVCENLPPEEPD